jgi:hypothetical protein
MVAPWEGSSGMESEGASYGGNGVEVTGGPWSARICAVGWHSSGASRLGVPFESLGSESDA